MFFWLCDVNHVGIRLYRNGAHIGDAPEVQGSSTFNMIQLCSGSFDNNNIDISSNFLVNQSLVKFGFKKKPDEFPFFYLGIDQIPVSNLLKISTSQFSRVFLTTLTPRVSNQCIS